MLLYPPALQLTDTQLTSFKALIAEHQKPPPILRCSLALGQLTLRRLRDGHILLCAPLARKDVLQLVFHVASDQREGRGLVPQACCADCDGDRCGWNGLVCGFG